MTVSDHSSSRATAGRRLFSRTRFKRIASSIPGIRQAFARARRAYSNWALRRAPTKDIFRRIYENNTWAETKTRSGPGSTQAQTATLVDQLPRLFDEWNVKTVLDIPCGDFHWMRDVIDETLDYIGADIVEELIANNSACVKPNVRFITLDLIRDRLPRVDAIFCRDCLVHFSNQDVWRTLSNVLSSSASILLTTTFPAHNANFDIPTGKWRPINLTASPFFLPPPAETIRENCTEGDGRFIDKSIGLWRLEDLRQQLRIPRRFSIVHDERTYARR